MVSVLNIPKKSYVSNCQMTFEDTKLFVFDTENAHGIDRLLKIYKTFNKTQTFNLFLLKMVILLGLYYAKKL